MVSKVYRICSSYESGVGKGIDASKFSKGDHLADPEEREAYEIGYEFGQQRRKRQSEKTSAK